MANQRVSPPRIFGAASRSGKPPISAAGSADTYRQTGFVLGAEVELVLAGLTLEGDCATASSGAKYRKQVVAAVLGLWSRSWLSRLQALHAIEWGNYLAAMPLVRAAADYQASALLLLNTGGQEWDEWLEQGGVTLAAADHATEFRQHAFRAAEVLAAHPILGPVYRAATELSLPHFGTTILLGGSDSTPDRVLMTFGDRDFHLGLAEIVLGWLLQLGIAQADMLTESDGVLGVASPEALAKWRTQAAAGLAREDRCAIEPLGRDGEQRYLVRNWRRAPGAAKKRVLL